MSDQPEHECPLCPRLLAYRNDNRQRFPDWHNGPVVSFGSPDACLLIVGLAPGLKGANRTGRPFTGDVAGDLLYPTLIKFGLAHGTFGAEPDDGLELRDCRITNAVRCAPPQNKVTGPEIAACRPFLSTEIANMKKLKVILALGVVAHGAVLSCLGEKKSAIPFAHAARHQLTGGLTLMDSYHCSRYNTNTGRLTTEMFEGVFNSLVGEIRGDRLS
ncbi:MAG: uracil-DNA glycosylase [Rhodospirillaceae bacterium]|nr:uracil-DNA glycosylase [Rhodospirillaceae bacterium]MBT5245393.1 uracil-DNA glycosylase [Rhodospirillaceae bacterium]MBT5562549.1 uracil-DNA glycosylase [Rhodospirillaceae bacterium]MBT6242878.1 uracil-DNA glycosylase [Rhodospirillaceae bacterium]